LAEFKNPNQPGGGTQDNRSLLVMMIVMFGLIFGVQWYRAKYHPDPPPQSPTPAQPAAATSAPSPLDAMSAMTPGGSANRPGAPAVATPSIQAAAESTTVVENELYRITFSNRGGQAISWILKKYHDDDGKPLDMVHNGAAKQFGYPLSLYTYDASLTKGLAQALYVPSATGALQAPVSLSFNYSAGNITVHKTFTFDATYTIHADTVVLRDGAPIRALVAWPAGLGDTESAQSYVGAQIDTSQNGKENHEAFKKVSSGNTLNGPFDWAGVSDQYFAAIFLPDAAQTASVATLYNQLTTDLKSSSKTTHNQEYHPAPANVAPPKGMTALPFLGAALGDTSGHTQTRIFVGPKAVDVIAAVRSTTGETLKPLLDFGYFGFIGKYLFVALRWIHTVVAPDPNGPIALTFRDRSWGWAIVLLTVLINVVLLPLRIQGMRAALKMQRIQPLLDEIKAKYKNPKPTDPKAAQMNAEIMQCQKDNGVSMFGGCIPTLVQLPLLFAFFSMLTKVVELRQAHFFWLPDLSQSDPYKILPIVMVITSFLVQFYTPSPGVDPQQQKMMAFMMPLFSGYITWTYASGLALYWCVGNFISIATQLVMNKTSLGREMREIAAKRARLKAGAPKTIQGKR
jgi:YidC/Oxa1 family membrane protein insertase